jgi:hypothetical protein
VLAKRGSNLFCRFTSRDEFFAARKLLIDAILGTDMHHHFALTQELLSHNTVFQAEEDADRTLLVRRASNTQGSAVFAPLRPTASALHLPLLVVPGRNIRHSSTRHVKVAGKQGCDQTPTTGRIWALVLQVKALLHAADISNHVRPFQIALAHAERVQQEFRRQVARERALGLPVSPHMDAPEQTWCKMEVQFIDYVAGPLWERLGQVRGNRRVRL